jgi:hypothetical protein
MRKVHVMLAGAIAPTYEHSGRLTKFDISHRTDLQSVFLKRTKTTHWVTTSNAKAANSYVAR